MRKMAQKMIAIAVAMVIVLGMASVTQMDTLAASYSFEGEAHVQTYGDRAGRLQEQHADTWHNRTGETVGADQDQVQQSDRV